MVVESWHSGPLQLDMSLIDEDPNQPRQPDNPGFSSESLEELAVTIRARGIKSPISVRENPHSSGRYLINHGSRRYRASKLAGKNTIPAFIDNDYNEADQVIENLQRNELTAREIADFIGRELAKGKQRLDIAKKIGKSPAFVTQHSTLLDLPTVIAFAFSSGRIRDVTVINELVSAYKKDPGKVEMWMANDSQEISRSTVKLLRRSLDGSISRKEKSSKLEKHSPITEGSIDMAFSKMSALKRDLEAQGIACSFFSRSQDPSKGTVLHLLVGETEEDIEQVKANYRPK